MEDFTIIEDGWDNLIVDLDDAYIFRFPRRTEVVEQLMKEIRLLPTLVQRLTMPVPDPEFVVEEDETVFMGYGKIHGTTMSPTHLTRENTAFIAGQISEFIFELQAITLEDAANPYMPVFHGPEWKAHYMELHERIVRDIYLRLDRETLVHVDQAWAEYLDNHRNFEFQPVLVHRDLSGDHVLFDPSVDTVTGVIDWGDACFGDPAFDLTGLLDYGPDFIEGMLERFNILNDDVLPRARFYRKIACFYEVIFGLDTGNEEHLKRGLENIRRSFAEK